MGDKIKAYIQSLYENKDRDELIDSLEQYANEHRIPIMEKDGIEFVKQLIRIYKPNNILEVGTAIGYSAIQMALANENTFITTIEINEDRYEVARKNVEQARLNDRIQVILSDALTYINNLDDSNQFDFIFIDAAKGQYQSYVESVDRLLIKGGLIVIDNVLFRGYVIEDEVDHKRLKKIGQKVDIFNKWLMSNENYDTSFVETGDGVAIAIKK